MTRQLCPVALGLAALFAAASLPQASFAQGTHFAFSSKTAEKRVLPARLRQLGFLLGQEAADRGSAYFELAGDLGFADTFAV
jgi:hypothetical protein